MGADAAQQCHIAMKTQIVPLMKQLVADKCPSNFNFDFVANGPVGVFVFACFAFVCCRHCRQTSPHGQPVIPSSEATQADGRLTDLVTFVNRLCSHDVLLERGAL